LSVVIFLVLAFGIQIEEEKENPPLPRQWRAGEDENEMIKFAKRDSALRFLVSGYFSTRMPQFAYRARDPQGGLVEGVLDCADRALAIRQIELQRCVPIRIDLVGQEPKAVQRDGAAQASPTQNLKIPHGQLLIFTE